jgi:hypothetical protein
MSVVRMTLNTVITTQNSVHWRLVFHNEIRYFVLWKNSLYVLFTRISASINLKYSRSSSSSSSTVTSWEYLYGIVDSSWLQIQRSGFDFRRYQIFREVVRLKRDPRSTTEELLERKSSYSSLESPEYDRRDPSRWPRGTLCPQKFELPSPTSGGRSIGIVRSRTQATEFFSCRCA